MSPSVFNMVVLLLFGAGSLFAEVVPNRYIVQFEPTVRTADMESRAAWAERQTGGVRGYI